MNKTETLKSLVDSLTGDATIYGDWDVEFRGRGGWWVFPCSGRWIRGDGIWIGNDSVEAKKAILKMWKD